MKTQTTTTNSSFISHEIKRIKTAFTDFHTLVWGDTGPKVLLLHGFPETPYIFTKVAQKLVAQGYQVFAPFMPGYGPTPPIHSHTTITHLDDLAHSIAALSDAISEGHCLQGKGKNSKEKIILVGHDWGAVAAYVTVSYYPEGFSKLVTMSVPPLPVFLKGFLRHPSQLLRSNYMLFFQLRAGIPEKLIARNDYNALKKLCLKWSGSSKPSQSFFSEPSTPFKEINNFTHPLGYYRGLFPLLSGSLQKWKRSMEIAFTKISIPCHIMVGEFDNCISSPLYKDYQQGFNQKASFLIVKNAGHFLPIDAPDEVVAVILKKSLERTA